MVKCDVSKSSRQFERQIQNEIFLMIQRIHLFLIQGTNFDVSILNSEVRTYNKIVTCSS
jgi:hypothetical protein